MALEAESGEPLSEEVLRAILARCEAATPGPWRASGTASYVIPPFGFKYKVAQVGGGHEQPGRIARDDSYWQADGLFIANARTDVALLLGELGRLRRLMRESDGPQ